MDTSKAVFATLPKSFRQRAESLSLTCENGKNTNNLFEKRVFYFQGFRWTCGILFWQSCWNSFKKNWKSSLKKRKSLKIIHFFIEKLHINFTRDTLKTVFTSEHFLLVVQNGHGKVSSFKKFSSNIFYLEVKCTFLDRPEKRLPDGPVLSCQNPQKNWKLT